MCAIPKKTIGRKILFVPKVAAVEWEILGFVTPDWAKKGNFINL